MIHLRPHLRPRRAAFTLIELMISIALVLLLILGVNQVFQYTSEAIGSGQAINSAVRNGRSIQTTLGDDLTAAVPNGTDAAASAGLVITSTSVYAYRDAADLAGDKDADPSTIDLNGDGTEGGAFPGEKISPVAYGYRNYRTDTLSFFARGKFPRQTGGTGKTGPFVAGMSSTEAWVWYGHLSLPDNSPPLANGSPSAYVTAGGPLGKLPSPARNPNNLFAHQFVLGREAILLRPNDTHPGVPANTIYSSETARQAKEDPQTHIGLGAGQPYWPLSATAVASDTSGFLLPDSRYDLATGTIPALQANLVKWLETDAVNAPNWWTLDNYPHTFNCNPFVPKPLDPQGMAQAVPYLVRGCTQFTVEFAGDFVTQNNNPNDVVYHDSTDTATKVNFIEANTVKPTDGTYGDVIANGSDGVLDFFVDKSADPNGNDQFKTIKTSMSNPALWQRHIRWYGLPRDDNGDGIINGWSGSPNTVPTLNTSNNSLRDVVPVRDVVGTTVHPELLTAAHPTLTLIKAAQQSFEHFPTGDQATNTADDTTDPIYTPLVNYATLAPSGSPPQPAAYTAAFGPFDPRVKLIRVTLTLDDPTGRLRDGQTYQYVFPVGAN